MLSVGIVPKVCLALLVPPIACLALCTVRVQTVHGWMMRHGCPLARFAMHPPARPMP